MNSNIQSSKTNQKLLTKLKKIGTLSLLAGSMIASMPASALGNKNLPSPDLFDDFGIQQATNKVLPAKVVKGKNRSVKVHTDLLKSESLTLNLFNDVVVKAIRDRLIDNVKGHTTWIGHVEGEQDSEVFLTVHGNTVSGNVQIGDKTYEIEPKGNNQHEITQVNPANNPKHSHSKQPEDFLATGGQIDTTVMASAPPTSAATAGTVIDLLVVYTPKALANATSQAGIEAKITNAVAMANQAYINSNIDMQLNLVGMAETNYVETGDMSTSLTALTGTSDGKMDEVHTLRNQLGADQVSLITADTNYCGIGYMMTGSWLSTAFAPYAFSVVHDDSVYACLSNQTMAHELGHNQGDNHNIEDSGGSAGAYSYSYGYRLCQTNGFRTVMSYTCSGGTRVSYFSNPDVTLTAGEVTGSSADNNALSMTNTKSIVAAFRSAPITLPNAPSSLSAAVLSSTQIALAWVDNSSNETGFRLERSVDGINWSEFAVVGSNVTSFTDTGLAGSTTYQYRIRAYNSAGNSSYSNIGTATTSAAAIDTAAPVVSILNPSDGSRVSGLVTVKVNASDNVSVSNLKLYIDGKLVSSGNTSSLSYKWNTKKVFAGAHTINSQATDPSNNIGSQSVSVTK